MCDLTSGWKFCFRCNLLWNCDNTMFIWDQQKRRTVTFVDINLPHTWIISKFTLSSPTKQQLHHQSLVTVNQCAFIQGNLDNPIAEKTSLMHFLSVWALYNICPRPFIIVHSILLVTFGPIVFFRNIAQAFLWSASILHHPLHNPCIFTQSFSLLSWNTSMPYYAYTISNYSVTAL